MAKASGLLEPAPAVPVSAQIRCFLGDNHDVAHARIDGRFAPRADVRLARLVRLDRVDDLVIDAAER